MQLKCHRKYLDIFNIDVICVGNNFMNLRYNSVMGIFVGKLLIFVGKLLHLCFNQVPKYTLQ